MTPSPEEPTPLPPPPSLPPLARTAIGVARIRAAESGRPDRLFDDPYAAAFVAAAHAAPSADPRTDLPRDEDAARLARWLAFYTSIRTRFYDDWLLAASGAGCRQVVLVAAGLDARAYRLPWPGGVHLYELDQPQILDFKQSVLDARQARPRCTRTPLGLDLRDDWTATVRAAGLDPGEPVAWLVEGLMVYLTPDDARTLLDRLTTLSAPGSHLACEAHTRRLTGDGSGRAGAELAGYTDLWLGGLQERLPGTLRELGWDVTVADRDAVAAGYGRTGPGAGGAGFVTAVLGTT